MATSKKPNFIKLSINGKDYTSFDDISRDFNISRNTLRQRWYYQKLRGKELIRPTKMIRLVYNGKIYDSFEKLEKLTGIKASTLRTRWYRGQLREAQLIENIDHRTKNNKKLSK